MWCVRGIARLTSYQRTECVRKILNRIRITCILKYITADRLLGAFNPSWLDRRSERERNAHYFRWFFSSNFSTCGYVSAPALSARSHSDKSLWSEYSSLLQRIVVVRRMPSPPPISLDSTVAASRWQRAFVVRVCERVRRSRHNGYLFMNVRCMQWYERYGPVQRPNVSASAAQFFYFMMTKCVSVRSLMKWSNELHRKSSYHLSDWNEAPCAVRYLRLIRLWLLALCGVLSAMLLRQPRSRHGNNATGDTFYWQLNEPSISSFRLSWWQPLATKRPPQWNSQSLFTNRILFNGRNVRADLVQWTTAMVRRERAKISTTINEWLVHLKIWCFIHLEAFSAIAIRRHSLSILSVSNKRYTFIDMHRNAYTYVVCVANTRCLRNNKWQPNERRTKKEKNDGGNWIFGTSSVIIAKVKRIIYFCVFSFAFLSLFLCLRHCFVLGTSDGWNAHAYSHSTSKTIERREGKNAFICWSVDHFLSVSQINLFRPAIWLYHTFFFSFLFYLRTSWHSRSNANEKQKALAEE